MTKIGDISFDRALKVLEALSMGARDTRFLRLVERPIPKLAA
jgi:hypothetical protein